MIILDSISIVFAVSKGEMWYGKSWITSLLMIKGLLQELKIKPCLLQKISKTKSCKDLLILFLFYIDKIKLSV